jgi:hypothetical protein
MANSATVLAVAAVVYDQSSHSEADLAFLDAMAKADREWLDALNIANVTFGGGSETWNAVKRLATRSRNDAYARALAALEANDDTKLLQAAE